MKYHRLLIQLRLPLLDVLQFMILGKESCNWTRNRGWIQKKTFCTDGYKCEEFPKTFEFYWRIYERWNWKFALEEIWVSLELIIFQFVFTIQWIYPFLVNGSILKKSLHFSYFSKISAEKVLTWKKMTYFTSFMFWVHSWLSFQWESTSYWLKNSKFWIIYSLFFNLQTNAFILDFLYSLALMFIYGQNTQSYL